MRAALTLLAPAGAVPSAYLLTLRAAAAGARTDPPDSGVRPRLRVVVPAHDEEAGIEATVASMGPPAAAPIVGADNCTDATAERARAAGSTVWERRDEERRGKGHALA